MNILNRIFLLLSFFFSIYAQAWEIPQIDCVGKKLPDISEELNAETNRRIQSALRASTQRKKNNFNLSKKKSGCDKTAAVRALKNALAQPWMNNIETWTWKAPVQKCEVLLKDSIFSQFKNNEMPVMSKLEAVFKKGSLSPIVNVGGVQVGTDKFAHFMTEGFEYWTEMSKSSDRAKMLKQGKKEEEGEFGWQNSGVKSYADMYANYHGFLFWKRLFAGEKPYLKCENGVWKMARQFDWREYIDRGFDELVNCNQYKTPSMEARANKYIAKKLTAYWKAKGTDGPKSCPTDSGVCKGFHMSPELAQAILHPACRKLRDEKQNTTEPPAIPKTEAPPAVSENEWLEPQTHRPSGRTPADAGLAASSEEGKLLKKFFDCSHQPTGGKILTCASSLIGDDPVDQHALLKFMKMPLNISLIRPCSEAELEDTLGLEDQTIHYICFDGVKDRSTVVGIAYFRQVNLGKQLSSVSDISEL
jgi:hypothetical protein